jgi:hypothetical protein
MKSVKTNKEPRKNFPKLMTSRHTGSVVLFTKKGVGTVVHTGTSNNVMGDVSQDWDMSAFVDFNGSVCLENG